VPAEEKAAYRKIFDDFYRVDQENRKAGKPGLSVGTVHVYVLTADGKPFDSLHVAEAKPERVTAMLKRAVEELKPPRGKPVVQPVVQSRAPTAKADSLVLHLTARYLAPRNPGNAPKDGEEEFVRLQPALGKAESGQWTALPAEDWIVLERTEWLKLLPPGPVAAGVSWELDRDVGAKLLKRFYPATENNDLTTNRIDRQALKATIVSVKDGVARASIEGNFKMKHAFYPGKADDNFVEATILGYLDFEGDKPRIRSLKLATDKAAYAHMRFGVAVRSVPDTKR
jgi:hypothetical protein